jgi:hypothetical protein
MGFFLWVVHKHIDLMEGISGHPKFVRDELTRCHHH